MNFALGQLLAQTRLEDADPFVVTTADIGIEITQIIIGNTNTGFSNIPVSLYHSKADPPVADDNSVLYKDIYVRTSVTLHADTPGGGIMLVRGDSFMVKGNAGITVNLYGVTANIAPGGIAYG